MKKGFTLVELSIVLVIIGLLIGGILVVQSMIENANMKATIRQVQQVHILAQQFKDKTKYLPGDLPNAYSLFAGACGINAIPNSSAPNGRCNGNGNKSITWGGTALENYIFWEHLYLMGMLDTAYTGDGYTFGTLNVEGMPGVNIMELPFKAVGSNYSNPGGLSVNSGIDSSAYRLEVSAARSAGGCAPQCDGILYSVDVGAYDQKIDDGVSSAGIVQGYYASGTWNPCNYSNSIQPGCILRFYQPPEYQ
ncbi:MAG: hypothetical protein COV36_00900 [Alphaproteobacteria bacterium CG11_big_fil_rev_8_21_14_0_20_44_7]|nr:MAG: hypothetical protein COV36_00900 [Alphaproteobacteria bacterium CG11_big_fil_rev_8_21_14_0_20_44_7]